MSSVSACSRRAGAGAARCGARPRPAARARQHADAHQPERRARGRRARLVLMHVARPQRPGSSQEAEARSRRSRSRLALAGAGGVHARGETHHPVAQRVDHVEVSASAWPAAGRSQCASAASGTRSTVAPCSPLAQPLGHRRVVGHQPDPVEPVLLAAQALAQLALQVEVLLAQRVAGAAGHAHQQPLALERAQAARRCRRGVVGGQRRAAGAAGRSARRRRGGLRAGPRSR